ncbi:DMT family transporter [Paracoccus siganidrum]|uniref:DMT family transporter n=1 Tax=Paracoccus siganidrum TaxID=1276757 RepID=A0A419A8Q6_9RHOB|nr:DMT family transporter [Paracoccus siganidrum]RJL18330.1 DMT family transporter [Paracoccus siganidrum]RMC31543.1 EamA family transporter [Paracoccus siganidrum]
MTDSLAGARREALRGHAAMLLFSVLVAGSFSLGVRAANLIHPEAITAARFVIAAGVIGGVAMAAGPGLSRRALRAPWRYLLLGGMFAAYFVLMFEGLKTAPAVSASAVFTLTPLMAAGFGWLLLRQRMTARIGLALGLGGFGALWVIFRGDLAAMARLHLGRGEAIYLVGCAAHALYTPMVRKLNRGESALVLSFGTMLAGSLVMLVWGWGAIRETDWAGLPAIVWITLLYVAIFASAATAVLVQYATLRLPSAKVMAYTYLTPAWVIALEAMLGQGLPGLAVLPGIIATLVALLMLLKGEE